VNCGNSGIDDAKRRQTTRNDPWYAEDVDGINAFGSTAQRGEHLKSPVAQRPPHEQQDDLLALLEPGAWNSISVVMAWPTRSAPEINTT
jgi:hypothetical protein